MFKVGDTVKIQTPWADKQYPNCSGVIVDMAVGNQVAIIQPKEGAELRRLHLSYLS